MPDTMTITEAFAEVKMINKKIEGKRDLIKRNTMRHVALRDPLSDDGGSQSVIQRELQAIGDLQKRLVAIREEIQKVNHATSLTLEGETKTVAEWLTWRREVAPGEERFLTSVRQAIDADKKHALSKGWPITETPGTVTADAVVLNWSESQIASAIERLTTLTGRLDGKLSLVNATTTITV